jgi:hypothetical protein
LDRVLEQKGRHQSWQDQPSTICRCAQGSSGAREGRRIGFDGAFDVPLFVQFLQPLRDALGVSR